MPANNRRILAFLVGFTILFWFSGCDTRLRPPLYVGMPRQELLATWGTPRTTTRVDTGEFGVYEGFEYWIGIVGLGQLVHVRLSDGAVIAWEQAANSLPPQEPALSH